MSDDSLEEPNMTPEVAAVTTAPQSPTRQCRKCSRIQPLEAFPRVFQGRKHTCRSCTSETAAKAAALNRCAAEKVEEIISKRGRPQVDEYGSLALLYGTDTY